MPNWTNPSPAEQLLFATMRLELRERDGSVAGAGTGFLLRYTKANGIDEVYLITNRHVVEGATQVVGYFTKAAAGGGPDVGNVFWVDLTLPKAWRRHPDSEIDLCALPLSKPLVAIELAKKDSAYFVAPSSTMLATHEQLSALDAFLPIIFVGYPNGIFDVRNFTPLLRQGFTASHPALDFCGRPDLVVDASVFPGSSGSPVLAYGLSIKGNVINYRILGVLRSVLYADDGGKLEFHDIPTAQVPLVTFRRFLNLGVVIKAPEVARLLTEFGNAPLLAAAT
jgi:hypothetical protein